MHIVRAYPFLMLYIYNLLDDKSILDLTWLSNA